MPESRECLAHYSLPLWFWEKYQTLLILETFWANATNAEALLVLPLIDWFINFFPPLKSPEEARGLSKLHRRTNLWEMRRCPSCPMIMMVTMRRRMRRRKIWQLWGRKRRSRREKREKKAKTANRGSLFPLQFKITPKNPHLPLLHGLQLLGVQTTSQAIILNFGTTWLQVHFQFASVPDFDFMLQLSYLTHTLVQIYKKEEWIVSVKIVPKQVSLCLYLVSSGSHFTFHIHPCLHFMVAYVCICSVHLHILIFLIGICSYVF